jgi:hypothetical protein
LEYLGLSMSKDQVVNTNIDGAEEGVKRALIPGHLLNANYWFELNRKKTRCAQLKAEIAKCQTEIDAMYP